MENLKCGERNTSGRFVNLPYKYNFESGIKS